MVEAAGSTRAPACPARRPARGRPASPPSMAMIASKISAGSAMQMGLAFSGLVVVGAMAMVMYELFSAIEKHTTGWAHRGSQH